MPMITIVGGWTGLMGPFTLKLDGTPVDLTNLTVVPMIRDKDGVAVAPGGTVAKLDQVASPGQLTYAPAAADFTFDALPFVTHKLYRLFFKVTDGGGKVVFFPDDDAIDVRVNQA